MAKGDVIVERKIFFRLIKILCSPRFLKILAIYFIIKLFYLFITNHPYTFLLAATASLLLYVGYHYVTNLQLLSMTEIDALNGRQFELYLAKLFRALGWYVHVTPESGDQGADLILMRYGKRIAVQAKLYQDKVDNKAIQEVVASKAYYSCTDTMVITNNYFTTSAKELADANKVTLWNRDRLATEIIKLSYPQTKKIVTLQTVGYYATVFLSIFVRFKR